MARALSVNDGKGHVNDCASQPRSCEGIDCRGKRAAWASTTEKSRHLRHESWEAKAGVAAAAAVVLFAPAPTLLGFEASSLERSGRDDVGIGGGASDAGCLTRLAADLVVSEPKPIDRADLLGG
jgi:hypothetical protein